MGQSSPRALEMWDADPMARQGSPIPACPPTPAAQAPNAKAEGRGGAKRRPRPLQGRVRWRSQVPVFSSQQP